MANLKRPRETFLSCKLKEKAWEDHPAKKQRLKVVCIETNKMHDVLSTALETDDRDYVTEEDLTVGNQLVWQKKKERVTVRVAQRGEAPKKEIFVEDSASGTDDDDAKSENVEAKSDQETPRSVRRLNGFSQQAQPWSKQTVDEFENMETQLPSQQSDQSFMTQSEKDKGKNSKECSYDELKRIRIAVEGILEHLITNSQTNKGIGGPILAYSGPHLPHQGSPAPPVPKQILPEVQPASPSGANHSPEYFLTESGVNLLNLRGADINKYALNLMDALYTEDELKTSSFVPVGKSSTSVKPPLSPQRMQLLEDCLRKKFGEKELKDKATSIRTSCNQKCRDKGKLKEKENKL